MKSKLLLGLSVFGVAIFSLQADSLRLRDGRVISGTFQGANRDEIRFQRDGGATDRYDIGSVDSITFGRSTSYNEPARRTDTGRYNDQGRYSDNQQRDQYGNT